MIRISNPAVAVPAVLLAAGLAAGCGTGSPQRPGRAGVPPAAWGQVPAGSAVHVPVPDYASPSSVAAAFYVAWASTDAVTDQPATYVARCAPLVTAALERQLAASQPATAAWAAMRREHLVSLVTVRAVTAPAGAPAPAGAVRYLRVYAVRVTTSGGARQVTSDGITVQVSRSGGRWLVSAVLFW